MTRKLISSGSTFEAEIGYSRAVVDGDWVFVSGTTGFDYSTMTIADGVVRQTEQCLKNIGVALEQAGASFNDIVRVTYVLPDSSEFEQCWPLLRGYFGEVRPAATMISAGLADPRMRIEIEVTARKRTAADAQTLTLQHDAHMPPSNVLKLDEASSGGEEYYLAPEKLVEGNPKQTVWIHYTDPTKQFVVGIWRSEPGKWQVAYTEEEYCQMLDGVSVITAQDGHRVAVKAGESFVVPRGFVGTWEVVETSTKRFVIYEANS